MYYPKSQILSNQYTYGKELYVKSSGKEYIGYYYIVSNGKIYSGESPQSNSMELIKSNSISISSEWDKNLSKYIELKKGNSVEKILYYKEIPSYYPNPTEIDYNIGYIQRYFSCNKNIYPLQIKEISKVTYEALSNQTEQYDYALNKILSIPWQISGPLLNQYENQIIIFPGVIDTNKKQLLIAEKSLPGISMYLTNLKEFYKRNF